MLSVPFNNIYICAKFPFFYWITNKVFGHLPLNEIGPYTKDFYNANVDYFYMFDLFGWSSLKVI